MSQLDKNIAVNLKRIRKSRNMSLDMLAEKTGVSKSMLGQIERGESNPTVATIEKIVDGIRIPFEELIYPKVESVLIIDNNEVPPYKEQEGAYQIKSIFPYERHRNFEVYAVTIEPGEECEGLKVVNGGYEYIMVMQGTLTLATSQGNYEVSANHTIRMNSEDIYRYMNHTRNRLELNLFLSYENVYV